MSVAKNWKKLVSSLFGPSVPRRRVGAGQQLRVESLEDRTTPTTLTPPATWTPLPTAPGGLGVMMLMTDGTVLAENHSNYHGWMKLTPDATGSYTSGTWTTVASMSLNRLYFGSNVLPDGRMFVLGGEYTGAASGNSLTANWTNTGEIYNPLTNTWAGIPNFPQSQFGDDPTVLLPNGKILAGYLSGPQTYLYDPAANSWAATGTKLSNDRSDEETFVLLPGGKVLTTEIFTGNPEHGQIYDSATGTWSLAGTIPVDLSTPGTGFEMGPAGLLPDGRVIYVGADGTVGANPLLGAPTALYTPSTNTWAAGPQIPFQFAGSDDAPGAVLPNGHFIFTADIARPGSGNYFKPPTHLFDFDPSLNTIADITSTLPATLQSAMSTSSAYTGRMLVLPTGQVLFTPNGGTGWVYTPDGGPLAAWRPTVSAITANGGGTYTITGTQLTGLSAGASYGDDNEMDSNYPIVQLTSGGTVYYARSHDWTPGVATGNAVVTSQFDLPAGIPNGTYQLRVIASGISSLPTSFIVGDTTGPITSGVSVSPSPTNAPPTTAFTISDATTGNSNVTAAEYFLDGTGTNGSGTAIAAAFGTVTVTGSFTVAGFAGLTEGTHTVNVHGKDAAGNWGGFATASFVKDTVAPTVSNVTSSTANGTYGTGAVISIQVTFSEAVTVTGTPTLALNSGGSASYTSGSGSNTLTFTYTVAAGENTPDLDYTTTTALLGTIKDAAANAATLTLPAPAATGSLGFNKNIVIDAVAPVVQHYYVLFGTGGKYDLIGSTRFDLPWEITGIQVVFSKAIAAGGANSLTGLTTTGFGGLGTNTLTWTFGPINLGVFSTALLGAGADALKDAAGNALSAGSGYLQPFKVLYGDVNDDGVVSSADMVLASRISAGLDPYSLFADMDGNGVVGRDDVLKIRSRIGTRL